MIPYKEKEIINFKQPLLGMTLEQLQQVVLSFGMPKYSALQIASRIYKKNCISIDEITELSKNFRESLSRDFTIGHNPPALSQHSADGTIKYLFDVGDNKKIESVYIPDKDRATLCVSSQVGCRMNCSFCATGRLGFGGNLTTHDIINQILSIPDFDKLTNVVFMGMGEPLDNIDAVMDSIEILTAKWGLEWSPKRITVSTIGKLDNLQRLLEDTKVHIAISVHSPFSKERESIMPVEKAFNLEKVIDLLEHYDFTRQRRCSFEYIMWKGINDDTRHANALIKLLRKIPGARVNLIRFHAFDGAPQFLPCSKAEMENFRDYLNDNGITATIRASRGEDIMAACGMLAAKENK